MNVLQVLPELKIGGVETGTVDLAKWLKGHGHKCVVVSGGGRLVRQLENSGIRHYELPVGKKSPFTIIPMIRALTQIIIKEDINVVHARSRIPAFSAFFAARATQRAFVTTAHGYYRRHAMSGIMGWGKFVIVASNVMARHMMENFGVPFDRIRLVPRGVDLDRYQFRPLEEKKDPMSDCAIGIIGRMTPLKGHPYFLKAVSLVAKTIPHLKVLIVGDPPPGKEKYAEEMKTLSRRLGVANITEFTDGREDISEVLKRLDLLVLSSVVPEGFGRVIIEAQASGVPVVATRVGGVVDIIEDGINGILATPKDPASLADGMIRILKDRELSLRLAKEARRIVEEKFSLEKMCRDTLSVYEEAADSKNILVIKISAIGDVILSVPSLRALRRKFPRANIKVLVGRRARNSLKGCPHINDTIVCDFEGKDRGSWGLLKVAGILRRHNIDIVVDLQNNRKSHLLSYLSCAPLRFGYQNAKFGFLLNRGIKDLEGSLGPVEHQFRILASLGIPDEDRRLEIWPSDEDREWAKNFLEANWISPTQTLAGVNIGASERWATKRWPLNNLAKLCDELSVRFGARVVITGIKKDMSAARKLASMTKARPIIACGKTNITQLAALMKCCRVFITADSAPIHAATAMGVPFVALFGPTDPKRHLAPYENGVIIRKDLRCSPCYKSRCILNYRCMRQITVEEVVQAAGGFLKIK